MKRTWRLQAVLVALLLWGLNPSNPYWYYTCIRIACFSGLGLIAFKLFAMGKTSWASLFGLFALIYNPFLRVHFPREAWAVVNLATVGVLIRSIFLVVDQQKEQK